MVHEAPERRRDEVPAAGKPACTACSGSGWYDQLDENGCNVPCGSCDGTGYQNGQSEDEDTDSTAS